MNLILRMNQMVWVFLTEFGEKTYMEHFCKLGKPPLPLEKTEGGWSKFELQELMFYFGSQCEFTGQRQFEDNKILLFEPN